MNEDKDRKTGTGKTKRKRDRQETKKAEMQMRKDNLRIYEVIFRYNLHNSKVFSNFAPK